MFWLSAPGRAYLKISKLGYILSITNVSQTLLISSMHCLGNRFKFTNFRTAFGVVKTNKNFPRAHLEFIRSINFPLVLLQFVTEVDIFTLVFLFLGLDNMEGNKSDKEHISYFFTNLLIFYNIYNCYQKENVLIDELNGNEPN